MHILIPEMDKFIQKATVLYLLLLILLRMMAMPISLLDYSFNKNYIARTLCENRLNTAVHCGGKCYLNKRLAKTNENADSQSQKGNIKILLIDYFENFEQLSFNSYPVKSVLPESNNSSPIVNGFTGTLLRPPIV